MKSEIFLAYCTFPDEDCARRLCEQLVTEGLIACANIQAPHRAVYKWNGAIQNHTEIAAWLKTTAAKKTALKMRFKELHPYSEPCLVFTPITDGLAGFLQWVAGTTL